MKLNLLLVTFSLRNPQKNYEPFFVALRGNALQWWHFIEQTCVVATVYDEHEFSRRLFPHMETTDSLLVASLSPYEFSGWLPPFAWEWLNSVSAEIQKQKWQYPLLPPPKP